MGLGSGHSRAMREEELSLSLVAVFLKLLAMTRARRLAITEKPKRRCVLRGCLLPIFAFPWLARRDVEMAEIYIREISRREGCWVLKSKFATIDLQMVETAD